MSPLKQALERKRDIWSDEIFDVFRGMEDCASTGFDDGFDKCLELLWPCVEALENIEEMGNNEVVYCRTCGDEETLQDANYMFVVRLVLKELKGKVGL